MIKVSKMASSKQWKATLIVEPDEELNLTHEFSIYGTGPSKDEALDSLYVQIFTLKSVLTSCGSEVFEKRKK